MGIERIAIVMNWFNLLKLLSLWRWFRPLCQIWIGLITCTWVPEVRSPFKKQPQRFDMNANNYLYRHQGVANSGFKKVYIGEWYMPPREGGCQKDDKERRVLRTPLSRLGRVSQVCYFFRSRPYVDHIWRDWNHSKRLDELCRSVSTLSLSELIS